MNVQLDTKIVKALEPYLLLNHPFYRRWEAGALHRDELTRYAEQYRYFERMLPSFLEKLIDQLPEGPIRDAVGANLTDEVSPPSHLELFERFARFYDACEAEMSPAMRRLVDAYSMILAKGPASSLAGLWAYESQGANIADSKADGLVTHYGAPDDAVEFWSVHGSLEGDHARWTRDALQALHPDLGVAVDAVALIGSAWWTFLDEREALAA